MGFTLALFAVYYLLCAIAFLISIALVTGAIAGFIALICCTIRAIREEKPSSVFWATGSALCFAAIITGIIALIF